MVRSEGGFALIGVLWIIGVLGALAATTMAPIAMNTRAAQNRVSLTRARWAARACVALIQARGADPALLMDSVSLGDGVWCGLESLRPDERVNPNRTDSLGLARLLRDEQRVAALLDWIDPDDEPREGGAEAAWYDRHRRARPRNGEFRDPLEVGLVRGFEAFTESELEGVFTTRGGGAVSPTRAPRWALETVTGVPIGLAARIAARRPRLSVENAEQVVAVLGLDPTIPEFRRMVERLSFDDGTNVIRAAGFAHGGGVTFRSELVATVSVGRGSPVVRTMELR